MKYKYVRDLALLSPKNKDRLLKVIKRLEELVELTNNSKATEDEVKKPQTFELPERIDLPTQTGDFLYAYPEMRCAFEKIRTDFAQNL